jgi:hypothetical protein
MRDINCRKIGVTLAILFLVGLTISTIYSRGYAERQKPYVHIVAPESRSFIWTWDTWGVIEPANEATVREGFDWSIDIIVPREAYSFYMEELAMAVSWPAEIFIDGTAATWPATITHRVDMDGDVALSVGFDMVSERLGDGIGAQVILESLISEAQLANLVPVSAVHHDSFRNEYYVFAVSRRDGIWGREFVVGRETVMFGYPSRVEDLMNLFGGINVGDLPIVTWSDQPLYDGAVVRLFD